jgi:hypothetical protein
VNYRVLQIIVAVVASALGMGTAILIRVRIDEQQPPPWWMMVVVVAASVVIGIPLANRIGRKI